MTSRRAALRGLGALGAAAALPGLVGACTPLRGFALDRGGPLGGGAAGEPLRIRYFSVGCALISWRGVSVLTDPFFSHLPFHQVATGLTLPDPEQVERYLPLLGDVRAVVVGHGHYDHVLDLPAVVDHLHPRAQVFASRTVQATFAPMGLSRPLIDANPHRADPESAGTWLEADGVRVLPVRSGHPDNIPGIHLFTRRFAEDRALPPTRAAHYQEGDTLAFLVDFLDGERVAFRVYVQSSSRGWPDGFVPPALLAERRVDVALLAMDCARVSASGRFGIVDLLHPRAVVALHWEDFFRRKDQTPWQGVKVNLASVKRRLDRDEPWFFPAWDAEFVLPPA